MNREARGKDLRQEHHDRAVEVGRTDADRDEGKHVEREMRNGAPAAREKRPARPKHHRRAENELHPAGNIALQPGGRARDQVRHGEGKDGERESETDPEAPRHIAQLGVFFFRAGVRDVLRLERHPADRAIAGVILLDLRVHRAGVDGGGAERRIALQGHPAFRAAAGLVAFHAFAHRAEIFLCRRLRRSGDRGLIVMTAGVLFRGGVRGFLAPNELITTMRRAKIETLAVVFEHGGGLFRVHGHPADRVDECFFVRFHFRRRGVARPPVTIAQASCLQG